MGAFVYLLTESAIAAPKEIGGTKLPSMTSKWIRSAPADTSCGRVTESDPKSKLRMDGASSKFNILLLPCARSGPRLISICF